MIRPIGPELRSLLDRHAFALARRFGFEPAVVEHAFDLCKNDAPMYGGMDLVRHCERRFVECYVGHHAVATYEREFPHFELSAVA